MKEATRLRMVVKRGLNDARAKAVADGGLDAFLKSESKILALNPVSQRSFALAFEKAVW